MTMTMAEHEGSALGRTSVQAMPSYVFEIYEVKGKCALRNGAGTVPDGDINIKSVTFDLIVPKEQSCFELVIWHKNDVLGNYEGAGTAKLCSGFSPSPQGKRVSAVFQNVEDDVIKWYLGADQPDCKLIITIKN